MTIMGLQRRNAAILLLGGSIAAAFALSTAARAQQAPTLAVNWNDNEIKDFVRDRATNPPRSVGAGDEAKLSPLKLPVLAFDSTPLVVKNSFGVDQTPPLERTIISDDANPVWYQITDRYGDITVTVDADLRVQHEFPANFPVYGTGPSAAANQGPEISVFEENAEEGQENMMVEYTLYKYPNIPYRITIECTPRSKDQCKDLSVVAKDRDLLKLISARPPQ